MTAKPATRTECYSMALSYLTATLPTNAFYVFDPDKFAAKYTVSPLLITVLTEMEFLKTDDKGRFQRSKGLLSVTPDQAMAWVDRYNAEKKEKANLVATAKEQAGKAFDDLAKMASAKVSDPEQLGKSIKPFIATEQPILLVLSNQPEATCSDDCGMNYCNQNGCVDNKPEDGASKLVPPMATVESFFLIWDGKGFPMKFKDKVRAIKSAKSLAKERETPIYVMQLCDMVECVYDYKVTTIP